jgi:hypothetical protein
MIHHYLRGEVTGNPAWVVLSHLVVALVAVFRSSPKISQETALSNSVEVKVQSEAEVVDPVADWSQISFKASIPPILQARVSIGVARSIFLVELEA